MSHYVRCVSLTLRWVIHPRIYAVKHHPQYRDQHDQQHAAFRPNGASGQPSRAMKRRIHQMPGQNQAAVGHGVEEGFAPVPSRVHANGKPQIPGPADGEAEEEADDNNSDEPDPTLARITAVDVSKKTRKQERCRPESDAASQREQTIATEKKFLPEPNDQEHHAPERRELQNAKAVQSKSSEIENTRDAHYEQQAGDCQ